MKLEFKNLFLKSISEFLYELNLAGKASRARQKLNKRIVDKLTEFSQDFEELKHDLSDDDLAKAQVELAKETAIVDVSEYKNLMEHLYDVLINYGYELSGQKAESYDLLLDELEKYIEEPSEANNENTELVEEK